MAPEQLAGKRGQSFAATSTRSDWCSTSSSPASRCSVRTASSDYATMHREATPPPPSALVPGLDPLVERVILRCLEKDPDRRPADARAVATALPGGDPLAAALALGETPSPQAVAAAGEEGLLAPRTAAMVLIGILVLLIAVPIASHRISLAAASGFESPDTLIHRSRQILNSLGYDQPPVDFAAGFADSGYLEHLRDAKKKLSRDEVRAVAPPALLFWYRQSPRAMAVDDFFAGGAVDRNDPPHVVSGMTSLSLDARGRLESFTAVPPEFDAKPLEASEPDWNVALSAAGFDPARLKRTDALFTPPVFADTRAAWTGSYPGRDDLSVRIEAASAGKRLVAFRIVHPWTKPARMDPRTPRTSEKITRPSFSPSSAFCSRQRCCWCATT